LEREEHRRRLHRDEDHWNQGRSGSSEQQERGGYNEYDRGGYRDERGRYGQGRGPGGYDQASEQRRAFETSGDDWADDRGGRRDRGTGGERRSSRPGGPGDAPYGRSSAPYDQGEMSSWYGGDSGMGDYGSSQAGPGANEPHPYGQWQRERGRQDRGPYERAHYEEGQHGGRFRFERPQRHQESFDGGQPRQSGQSDWRGDSDRGMRGPFVGRGPRGYQRSDERILEEVCELLTHHGEIDASQMDVDVRNGEIYLRGMVDSGYTRRLTEEVVEEVPGVRDVRNELRLNQRTGYAETNYAGSGQQDQYGQREQRVQGYNEPDRRQAGQARYERTGRGGALDTDAPAYGTGVANTSGAVSSVRQTEHGEAGGDRIGSRFTIHESMEIVGADGESVGQVTEVRGTDFLVGRPGRGEVYVPFSGVQTVDGDRVMLDVRAGEVDRQGWPTPDLTGTSQQRPSGGG
jgi:hypothetical protein